MVYGMFYAIKDTLRYTNRISEYLTERKHIRASELFYTKPLVNNPYDNNLLVCRIIDVRGKWVRYEFINGIIKYIEIHEFVQTFRHVTHKINDTELNKYQLGSINEDIEKFNSICVKRLVV